MVGHWPPEFPTFKNQWTLVREVVAIQDDEPDLLHYNPSWDYHMNQLSLSLCGQIVVSADHMELPSSPRPFLFLFYFICSWSLMDKPATPPCGLNNF